MRVLTLQQRLRIIILILFCAVLAILVFVVYPTVHSILTLQSEIDTTEQYLEDQYERSRRRNTEVIDIDAFVTNTEQFQLLTVSATSELALIKEFEQIAERHMIVQQLQIRYSNKPHPRTGRTYFEFNFANSGTLEHHMAYLHDMLTLPYMVSIDGIDMRVTNKDATREEQNISLRFKAIVYVN